MKKSILLIALVAMAVSANAACIDWNLGGSATRVVNGVKAESKDATSAISGTTALSSTVYLLIASDLSGLSGNTSKDAFLSNLALISVSDTYSTSDGKKPAVSAVTVTSDLIQQASQTYGVLVFDTDSFGNGWYKIATATGTGYAPGASADARTTVNTSWNNVYTSSWTKAWTVPEPSTSVLALAGLALLLKRRRA